MKVALVHDDLMQWGGAERVLLAISEIYPEAPIYTSIFNKSDPNLVNNFKNKKIITSFMQKIPGRASLYKLLLPLYPIAFEQFDFSSFDLVISSTTRFAKSIITKPNTLHICYCHTPVRFLWGYPKTNVNFLQEKYFSFLRLYDSVAARRVDYFIAGSENAKQRIKKNYRRDSTLCKPFVDDIFFSTKGRFDGDYYLIISRLTDYKKIDVAVKAFNQNGKKLKIIGTGSKMNNLKKLANSNIEFYESISDNLLLVLLQGASALIIISEEDFGLTSLESQAMGKPVIAFDKGGARETIKKNLTGIFFENQSVKDLNQAIDRFEKSKFSAIDCIDNALGFSKINFKNRFSKVVNDLLN